VNYRSVVLLGTAVPVVDPGEKTEALRAFTKQLVPGRWDDIRPPTPQERKATSVLYLALEEVSANVRTGPPVADDEDYALDVWAGVVPLSLHASAPVPDERLQDHICPTDYVTKDDRQ